MFTDSPFEIEASDIDTLVRAGNAVKLSDGRVALPVLLVLADHSGKVFSGDEFPTAMHLTNGVQVRRMVFEHLGAAVIEVHAAPDEAPAAAAEPSSEPAASNDTANDVAVVDEAAAEPAVSAEPEPAEEPAEEVATSESTADEGQDA